MSLKGMEPEPDVNELLRRAAKPSLTRQERQAQSVSFAMGMKKMSGVDTGLKREEIEKMVRDR